MSMLTTGTDPAFSTEGGYIILPITTDANQLMAIALAAMAEKIPGWVPVDGNVEVALLMAVCQVIAELAQTASLVPLSIFRYYGGLVGILPESGSPASVATTWTTIDTQGYRIPAGTYVTFPVTGSDVAYFQVLADVTIPPGASATQPGEVILVATAVGAIYNGLAGTYNLYDSLAFVAAINATAPSSGGADPETDLAYLERLAAQLQLLTPRPILPPDFAVLARNVAGVTRAVAIDTYNPADGTYGNERMVTICAVDALGDALTSAQNTAIKAYLDGLREVNFVVNTVNPSYTTISVTAVVVTLLGATPAVVQAACMTALGNFLSPANWGGGNQTPPQWFNETTVRYLEIAAILGNVPGVDYVQATLQIGAGASPAMGYGDIALPGPVGLPRVGTLNIAAI